MSTGSPLASPAPWDLVSGGYAADLIPFFERFAEGALDRAGVGADSDVLDVATGPGTLAVLAAPRVRRVAAVDFSERMLEIARGRVGAAGLTNVELRSADGQSLPFEDASFDAAFSMFGLMFFPDRAKGFAELRRVLRPGGRAVVTSWTPSDESPLLAALFGAVRAAMPELPLGGGAAPLSSEDDVLREMESAGFEQVSVERVSHAFEAESVASFWTVQLRSSAPVALLKSRMRPEEWEGFGGKVLARLREEFGDGPLDAGWSAFMGIGTRGGDT